MTDRAPLSRLLHSLCALIALAAVLLGAPQTASAEAPDEIRGLWAQAWVADLHSEAGVDKLIADARVANMNTLFVQMRRRGDTLYFSDIEPRISSGVPGFATFDSLAYILEKAREQNPPIEVHAWIVVYPVAKATSDPQHVTNAHPEWMTQDLFGAVDQTLDPGHPGVQKHLLDVAMELVTKYDIDGLHYDYIRYYGNEFGYNPVSLQRFQELYNRNDIPSPTDPEWSDFRRNQVTQLVRSIYLNAIDVRPEIKISAATITWSPGPANLNDFPSTRPYYDILSNWPAWMEEGIIDLNTPMAYFREFNSAQKADYRRWNNFIKDTRFNRHAAIGPGIYMNSITDSITQMRESRTLSPGGTPADGVVGYVYHETNNQGLPFNEFRKALTEPSQYDSISPPMFAEPAGIPDMPWKSAPTTGHIKGHVHDAATDKPLDGAWVHLTGPVSRSIDTDALGFYGFVDLPPGEYELAVSWNDVETGSRPATVTVGQVTTSNLDFGAEPGPDEGQLQGYVLNKVNGKPVASATVHLSGPSNRTVQTTHDGFYRFLQVDPGFYTINASWSGAPDPTPEIMLSIAAGVATDQNLHFVIGGNPIEEIILDNLDDGVVFTGPDWRDSGNGYGSHALFTHTSEHALYAGPHTATFTPALPSAGFYQVDTWYFASGNRTSNAPFTVSDGESETVVIVNQQINGGQWFTLADSIFLDPANDPFVKIGNTGSPSVVFADAMRWTLLEAPEVLLAITASVEGQGRIEGLPEDGVADYGTVLELEAIGESDFVFSHWDGQNAWGTENPLSLAVGADLEFRAVFESPWLNWLADTFDESELQDPSFIAPQSDPFGHGISNLLKFAFGMDLRQPDRSLLPAATADSEGVNLTFRRLQGDHGLEYKVEFSSDFAAWSSDPARMEETVGAPNGDGTETVTVRVTVNDDDRLFVRLLVDQK